MVNPRQYGPQTFRQESSDFDFFFLENIGTYSSDFAVEIWLC